MLLRRIHTLFNAFPLFLYLSILSISLGSACVHTHTRGPLHIPTDAEDKEDVFPLHPRVCPRLRQERECSLTASCQEGTRNHPDEGEPGPLRDAEEDTNTHTHSRAHIHTHTLRHTQPQTENACTRKYGARQHTGSSERARRETHTRLQGLRERVRES